MIRDPLVASELELVRSVLRQHREIECATLFGSRAKGTHTPRSDVDLALAGPLEAFGSHDAHNCATARAAAGEAAAIEGAVRALWRREA